MSSTPPPSPAVAPDAAARAEAAALHERYARRPATDWRYDRLNPAALWPAQERERAVAVLLRRHGWHDLRARDALELGCGTGGNLLELLRLGFVPSRLRGLELLTERAEAARAVLPPALRIDVGDALAAEVAPASQDLVLQFTVFSSVLDAAVQQQLATAMWGWLRPGGAVLWYDFTVDNPRNPDVRGVPAARLPLLFPQARIDTCRLTLAPPIARAVCRLHPALYTALAWLPPLRTHLLAWIAKPGAPR